MTGSDLEAIRSELARIRELESEASKGPWEQQSDGWTVRQVGDGGSEDRGPRICATHPSSAPLHEQVANSEFIASARTDVPRLVSALDIAVELLRDAHANWDCDTGANGTHPDYCRPCCAEKALADIVRLLVESETKRENEG